jgi:hypothetical protein
LGKRRRKRSEPRLELEFLKGATSAEPIFLTIADPERGEGLGERLLMSLRWDLLEGEISGEWR